jgi:acetolactate decarboxylase
VIALDTLQSVAHLFALGAVENLKGEVLIYDSNAFVASVQDSGVVVARDFNHKAALLVFTQIKNWREVEVPSEVQDATTFEAYLLQTAEQHGLKLDAPLPFRLEGKASIAWHVIDWAEGDTVHTHEKHRTSGLHGRLENEAVEIMGFYSNQHHGIITHRGSNLHLHVKTASGTLAAHVDDFEMRGGMLLLLPGN